jgi:hypothetical protein
MDDQDGIFLLKDGFRVEKVRIALVAITTALALLYGNILL